MEYDIGLNILQRIGEIKLFIIYTKNGYYKGMYGVSLTMRMPHFLMRVKRGSGTERQHIF